jgi:hypothetical protein
MKYSQKINLMIIMERDVDEERYWHTTQRKASKALSENLNTNTHSLLGRN